MLAFDDPLEDGEADHGIKPEVRPHGERAPPDFGAAQRQGPVRNGQQGQQEMARTVPVGQDAKANGQHEHGKQPINGH